ncbi:MAG TPA: antibiotic acetyltransferase [Amaricoccus sp.]|nr:antibiotic acetyltransferase [Amaricoccus sp.]
MSKTAFSLTGETLAALDHVGLRLPGLRQTHRLAPGSRIEAPTSIISTVAAGALLEVGAFCNLSGGTINNVRFGRYCSVASGVVIGPHEHPTDWLTTSRIAYYPEVNGWDELLAGPSVARVHALRRPFAESCPTTTIGPDVWIGQGAFIKAGATIGAGAIIGARATVLRDVPPYAIVVGTPGRVLRLRFPEATVERLLAVEWWRYSLYDLFGAPMDSIDTALDVIEARVAAGAVAPYAGRDIVPDLADPARLVAALTADPLAQAS